MACATGSTRMPDDAEPSQPGDAALNEPLLRVSDLRTWFFTDAGVVRAVDGVSFTLNRGETLGIVGESGSGKSVAAKSIMNLLEEPARIVAGSIRFRGQEITALSGGRAARHPRRRDRHGVPGPDDVAEPGAAHFAPADRDDDRAIAASPPTRPAPERRRCWGGWEFRVRNGCWIRGRTSSPAACASA